MSENEVYYFTLEDRHGTDVTVFSNNKAMSGFLMEFVAKNVVKILDYCEEHPDEWHFGGFEAYDLYKKIKENKFSDGFEAFGEWSGSGLEPQDEYANWDIVSIVHDHDFSADKLSNDYKPPTIEKGPDL